MTTWMMFLLGCLAAALPNRSPGEHALMRGHHGNMGSNNELHEKHSVQQMLPFEGDLILSTMCCIQEAGSELRNSE